MPKPRTNNRRNAPTRRSGLTSLPRTHRRTAPGAPPGTIVVDRTAPAPSIDVVAYDPDNISVSDAVDVKDLPGLMKGWRVTWVNVVGLGSADVIQGLGALFKLHGLALEDVVHLHQRPKVDEYEDFTYIVARMLRAGPRVETEQVSIFLGANFVLTFQEKPGDCFDPVRERIRGKRGRIRQEGPDYLAYALIDAVIDSYFPALEHYGELVENLETQSIHRPSPGLVPRIHTARRELMMIRRAVWPLREIVNSLIRDPSTRFTATTQFYLRDCYDHTVQLLDLTETYRDVASSLFDLYLTGVSTRMNEIMKVLTVIATIFIPLSFIASVYGMNFDGTKSPLNMPELRWTWGYPFALALMATTALGFLAYFRKKGWILTGRSEPPQSTGQGRSP